ncbi:hypothetical protein [Streptomyces sp. NPDC005828]|uniref:hypothetical protein n=1 Tax=Streptomyces sp. NPDC005828 TaxID=3157071 RepID=UPI00340E7DB5
MQAVQRVDLRSRVRASGTTIASSAGGRTTATGARSCRPDRLAHRVPRPVAACGPRPVAGQPIEARGDTPAEQPIEARGDTPAGQEPDT